jgi:Tol biopolymer transport system component
VTKTTVALLVLGTLVTPASAFHRQTPPIVPLTFSGDTPLPRIPAGGRRIVLAIQSGGWQVFRQDRTHNLLEQITTVGDNENPTISSSGSVMAWDSDCTLIGCPDPGRQVFVWVKGATFQVTHDMSGTSSNPALNGRGNRIAFESTGDLANMNKQGARQIFVWSTKGTIVQASIGTGTSRNPAYDRGARKLVFESTSTTAGGDSGIAQIWLVSSNQFPVVLTNGAGPSTLPSISSDGHIIVFQSTADLSGDRHDTHVPQIFSFDTLQNTLTQVTNDSQGCTEPTVSEFPGDYHVVYTCHGSGFVHYLEANQTFHEPSQAGDTDEAIAELGGHFMVVSSTASLLGSGTTPGHQVYMLNLFKLGGEPMR